jgi:hypothetical protein
LAAWSQRLPRDARIDGLGEAGDDARHRAMDALTDIEETLAEQVCRQVADLLNLKAGLLFFDTASTCLQTGQAYEPAARDGRGRLDPRGEVADPARDTGFRACGKSEDHRDDPPQIVTGMAVAFEGIPERVRRQPGDTGEAALIRQVKDDMRDQSLARIVWVAAAGSPPRRTAAAARRRAPHHRREAALRLRRGRRRAVPPRRHARVAENTQAKEVNIDDAEDRFAICFNPDQADATSASERRSSPGSKPRPPTPAGCPSPNAPRRAPRSPPSPPRAGACASRPAACRASTKPRPKPSGASTASACRAAATRNCPKKTSPPATSNCQKPSPAGAT